MMLEIVSKAGQRGTATSPHRHRCDAPDTQHWVAVRGTVAKVKIWNIAVAGHSPSVRQEKFLCSCPIPRLNAHGIKGHAASNCVV